jgi:uncharacterized membrane protein
MGKQRGRRRTAPKRTLIGPLVMLAGGVAVGAVMWRLLMLEPAPSTSFRFSREQLSRHDRQALDRLLSEHPIHQ